MMSTDLGDDPPHAAKNSFWFGVRGFAFFWSARRGGGVDNVLFSRRVVDRRVPVRDLRETEVSENVMVVGLASLTGIRLLLLILVLLDKIP